MRRRMVLRPSGHTAPQSAGIATFGQMEEEREVTPGGSEVFRHEEPAEPPPITHEAPVLDVVQDHVEQHLGPIESVFHEIVSPYVHLDVLQVPPSDERPGWTLVTCGMSAQPMAVPAEIDPPRFTELMIVLPPDWQLSEKAFKDERWYWPVRMLKTLGRLPHEYGTWLGEGHTVPNGDPPEPYAPGTELCGALVLRPMLVEDEFEVLERPGEDPIHFLGVVPVYAHEMDFKLEHGAQALVDAWREADVVVTELIKPDRPGLPGAASGRGRHKKKRFGLF